MEAAPVLCSVCPPFSLQVGNNDVDDVNIIVFRQINQFDLSGNVITSSEYLSTLWVRVLKKTQESVGEMLVPAGSGFSLLHGELARQLPAAGHTWLGS